MLAIQGHTHNLSVRWMHHTIKVLNVSNHLIIRLVFNTTRSSSWIDKVHVFLWNYPHNENQVNIRNKTLELLPTGGQMKARLNRFFEA